MPVYAYHLSLTIAAGYVIFGIFHCKLLFHEHILNQLISRGSMRPGFEPVCLQPSSVWLPIDQKWLYHSQKNINMLYFSIVYISMKNVGIFLNGKLTESPIPHMWWQTTLETTWILLIWFATPPVGYVNKFPLCICYRRWIEIGNCVLRGSSIRQIYLSGL